MQKIIPFIIITVLSKLFCQEHASWKAIILLDGICCKSCFIDLYNFLEQKKGGIVVPGFNKNTSPFNHISLFSYFSPFLKRNDTVHIIARYFSGKCPELLLIKKNDTTFFRYEELFNRDGKLRKKFMNRHF